MVKKSDGKRSVYFIGIGGIGMSALARYFKAQGYGVSGSDAARSTITDSLLKDAIRVKIGHKKGAVGLTAKTSFVIYNRAIPTNNPELAAAKKLGVPVIPYAKILGSVTEQYATAAITGSHGKSTTTSLAGLALIAGSIDPTVLVGTNLKEFHGKNIRMGKSPYLVIEADDFGAAFLEYSPLISIVTNIDREHMDFYKTFGAVQRAFLKFMERTRQGGVLIVNRDDENLLVLKARIDAMAKKKALHIVWYSIKDKNPHAIATLKKLKKIIKIPGDHNLSNAMAVIELGKLLHIPEKKTLAAIGSYQGSWRRMEYRGKLSTGRSSAIVYDDYAHHPTEIKATLQGFREKFPGSPLICVFQPHQAKRLQVLFKEFAGAFTQTDALILIPSYNVAGRDKINAKFTAERLAAAIIKKYPHRKIYYLENPKHIKKTLTEILSLPAIRTAPKSPSPVIIMMGAGDIVNYTDLLLK